MTLYVSLSEEERARYERSREIYRGFVQQSGINMSKPDGWSKFLYLAFRSPEGREAFHASLGCPPGVPPYESRPMMMPIAASVCGTGEIRYKPRVLAMMFFWISDVPP